MASGLQVSETPTPELIRLMTGRSVENVFPARRPLPEDAEVVLAVEDLGLRGAFTDVSFDVRAGRSSASRGSSVRVAPRSSRPSTRTQGHLRHRLGRRQAPEGRLGERGRRGGRRPLPEERKSQGLILEEPIFKNVTLATFACFARACSSTSAASDR